jgi:PleD family two-component response regulator
VADIVTISIGVATVIPGQSARPDILVTLADQALYESKSGGRNQIRCQRLDATDAPIQM